ncbi:MAG: TRAP transporter TatT component family protein [Thiohalomonadales bacterium]
MKQKITQFLLILVISQLMFGCSLPVESFSNDLNKVVMSNNDPQTVMQALPAYIMLIDGLIESDPEDEELLVASAKLMNSYAGLLGAKVDLYVEQPEYQQQIMKEQQKKLNQKALQRVSRALCLYDDNFCDLNKIQFTEFKARLSLVTKDDVEMIYNFGTSWLSWVQVNSDDWNAKAKLPQIKLLMEAVVKLDENWQHAGAHMYLGVLNSLLPETLGGKPEQGKAHFEDAIRLTDGKNLMAKVLFAEYYARLVFNKDLHQQLISEVINSKVSAPGLTLSNTLAKQKAKVLQLSAADYF